MNIKPKYNPNIHHRRSIRLKGYDYSQAGLYFVTICCQDRECRFGKIENDEMILNEFGNIAYNEWAKLTERFANFQLDVFQIMPNHMHGIIMLNDNVGAGFTPAQNAYEITPAQNAYEITPAQNAYEITPAQNAYEITPAQNAYEITPAQNAYEITPAQNAYEITPAQNTNEIIPINEKGQPQGIAPTTIGDIVGAYKSLSTNGCLGIYKSKNEMMGKLWQRNYHEHIIRNEQSYQTISDYIINNPAKWMKDKFYQQ